MPQFDFYSFASQTFWFLVFLGFFYFFVLFFYLSKYSETFKFRKILKFLYFFNKDKVEIKFFVVDSYISTFLCTNVNFN